MATAEQLARVCQQPGKAGRNPAGRNGFTKFRQRFVAFAEELDGELGPEHHDTRTRHREACFQLYDAIKDNSDPSARVNALKLWFEQLQGKGKAFSDLDLAEHFRQVERDRMDVALKLLGDRINSWAPEKVRDFLLQCARDPRGFMQAAEEYLAGGASGGNPAVAEAQPIEAEPDAPVSMILGGPADARAGETPPSIVSVQQGPPGGSTKEYLGTKEEEAQALPETQAEQPQALPDPGKDEGK